MAYCLWLRLLACASWYLPVMQIDAQTYEVRADGQLLTCEPAKVLPMAQRYFLF